MVMRLLKKKEIDKLKAADRKREIDEGIKLATRVDGLRQLAASEETQLETFRVETLKSIHEETAEAIIKRDTLTKEVAELEDRKKVALEPLTEAWNALNEEKASFNDKVANFDLVRKYFANDEADLVERKKNLELEEARVRAKGITLDDNIKESAKLKAQNKQLLEESVNSANIRTRELDNRERAVASRETAVLNREQNASVREAEQDMRERALNNKEVRQKDREALKKKQK